MDLQKYDRGLSGDAFLYTRAAVVADGPDAYPRVLRNPATFTWLTEVLR
ncbi:DUF4240 domain-containing protein [Streptomyces brasiliensis]|uniref:DUF4240 domain-containing protein n=1 Tax=Streptomyces brasiliensis TaxID=1954 RepID=A0A917LD51_9ACTN|nr:DUF4240 domain-containing protein [Streptomyces brasiliensis]GGJ56203.1 hypothetical protein GCM10010121_078500 [Streptomyces brasiliensis]